MRKHRRPVTPRVEPPSSLSRPLEELSPTLFRKMRLAVYGEARLNHYRIGARLPSATRELVRARRDDSVSGFVYVAQGPRVDGHMDVCGLARTHMHTVE